MVNSPVLSRIFNRHDFAYILDNTELFVVAVLILTDGAQRLVRDVVAFTAIANFLFESYQR